MVSLGVRGFSGGHLDPWRPSVVPRGVQGSFGAAEGSLGRLGGALPWGIYGEALAAGCWLSGGYDYEHHCLTDSAEAIKVLWDS